MIPVPNINYGTAGRRYSCTEGALSCAQCVVNLSPLDLRPVSLSTLDLSTVADCPEDSVSHIFVLFINLIHKLFSNLS